MINKKALKLLLFYAAAVPYPGLGAGARSSFSGHLPVAIATFVAEFKALCEAVTNKIPQNEAIQFQGNRGKFCLSLMLTTGACAILVASLFYAGLVAAMIVGSEGARRMLNRIIPKLESSSLRAGACHFRCASLCRNALGADV